jgi:hypothetical protein
MLQLRPRLHRPCVLEGCRSDRRTSRTVFRDTFSSRTSLKLPWRGNSNEAIFCRQRWVNEDAMYGRFFAQGIDIADEGRRGTVIITDRRGNVLDTFSGTAAAFQASGEWQLIEPVCMMGLYSRLVKARQ